MFETTTDADADLMGVTKGIHLILWHWHVYDIYKNVPQTDYATVHTSSAVPVLILLNSSSANISQSAATNLVNW